MTMRHPGLPESPSGHAQKVAATGLAPEGNLPPRRAESMVQRYVLNHLTINAKQFESSHTVVRSGKVKKLPLAEGCGQGHNVGGVIILSLQ